MSKNIWSDDDLTERMANLAVFKVPFTGKEMGCSVLVALPLASLLLLVGALS